MNRWIRSALTFAVAGLMIAGFAACSEKPGTETSGTAAVSSGEAPETALTSGTAGAAFEVYDASKESGTEFSIPAVRINGVDDEPVNKKIREYVESLDREWFTGSEYSYYAGDGYLSLILRGVSNIDLDDYEAFNISLETGELLDKDQFLAILGEKDFGGKVSRTVGAAMDDDRDSLFGGIEGIDYRAENMAPANVEMAVPFVSERGHLCFVYLLYMNVGAEEYTLCFDTETHEHMLNDFGRWSLYPDWG